VVDDAICENEVQLAPVHRSSLYPVTPTSSVAPDQPTMIFAPDGDAKTLEGGVGACVSAATALNAINMRDIALIYRQKDGDHVV